MSYKNNSSSADDEFRLAASANAAEFLNVKSRYLVHEHLLIGRQKEILYLRIRHLTSVFEWVDAIISFCECRCPDDIELFILNLRRILDFCGAEGPEYLILIPVFEFAIPGVVLLLDTVFTETPEILSSDDITKIRKLEKYVDEGNSKRWNLTFDGKGSQRCTKHS